MVLFQGPQATSVNTSDVEGYLAGKGRLGQVRWQLFLSPVQKKAEKSHCRQRRELAELSWGVWNIESC